MRDGDWGKPLPSEMRMALGRASIRLFPSTTESFRNIGGIGI
jgi:hypothetical protein